MLNITRNDCLEGRGDVQLSALSGELNGLPFKWFIVGTRGAVDLVTPALGSARRRFRERLIDCYPLHKRRPHAVRSAGCAADQALDAAVLDWVYAHAPEMLSLPSSAAAAAHPAPAIEGLAAHGPTRSVSAHS